MATSCGFAMAAPADWKKLHASKADKGRVHVGERLLFAASADTRVQARRVQSVDRLSEIFTLSRAYTLTPLTLSSLLHDLYVLTTTQPPHNKDHQPRPVGSVYSGSPGSLDASIGERFPSEPYIHPLPASSLKRQ